MNLELKALECQRLVVCYCCLKVANFEESVPKVEPAEQMRALIMHTLLEALYCELYISGIQVVQPLHEEVIRVLAEGIRLIFLQHDDFQPHGIEALVES